MPPLIRLAEAGDLPAINAIYNHYVLHSTCTYQLSPSSGEERREWFEKHGPTLPVTVAAAPSGEILGWGSLNPFHPRPGWRFTVENSVYVHPKKHRQGVGRALLADLLRRSDELAYQSVIAIISADQLPSVAIHQAMGFAEVGRLIKVGYKFERWLDVVYMQRSKAGL